MPRVQVFDPADSEPLVDAEIDATALHDLVVAWLRRGALVFVDKEQVELQEGRASEDRPTAPLPTASPERTPGAPATHAELPSPEALREYEAIFLASIDKAHDRHLRGLDQVGHAAEKLSGLTLGLLEKYGNEVLRQTQRLHQALEELNLVDRGVAVMEIKEMADRIDGLRAENRGAKDRRVSFKDVLDGVRQGSRKTPN